ncbi:MAG TPA: hypothetical protein VNO55_27140 [Polyangia bacterium]|nr:hypothetical protein [Polyangia bacterium]
MTAPKVRIRQKRRGRAAVILALAAGAFFCVGVGLVIGRWSTIRGWTATSADGVPKTPTLVSAAGPWGRLEYTRIDIEPPAALIPKLQPEKPRWFFPGRSQSQVVQLLMEAEIATEEVDQVRKQGVWESVAKGTFLSPPLEFVVAMPSHARRTIYSVLAQSDENPHQRDPIPISPTLVDALGSSGLSESTVATFRALLYGPGPWLAFADLSTQLVLIPDEHERMRFATFVLTTESYLARLRIDSSADIDGIARYWGAGGQVGAMRPLLEAVTRVKGGSTVNVAALLPPLPRGLLNRYPAAGDPIEAHSDCFWTSLNFFADRPSGRVDDPAYVAETLRTRYRPTGAAPKLGDLIVLVDGHNTPVHAAVYLADDFVFTKNGYGPLHPWTLMKVPALVNLYTALKGPLREITVDAIDGG